MENKHLHLLIDEEIYVIKSQVENGELSEKSDQLNVDSVQSTAAPTAAIESGSSFQQNESREEVKIAFIHNGANSEELDLLNKIVDACDLANSEFRILKKGEDIGYEKAVIFIEESDQLYVPLVMDQGKVMYSRPLNILSGSKEEKGKLWTALQSFV